MLWIVPILYVILLFGITFNKNMYGLDLAIELSTSMSGAFNVIQFFIQKNGMNNLLTDYLIHIIGLSIYQGIVLSLGRKLLLKYNGGGQI